MPDGVPAELDRMRLLLSDLEARLEAGEVAYEGLPEFKRTLDEVRLRTWALLTAAGADDPRGVAERFRLRRAVELCRALTSDLQNGHVAASHAEWQELRAHTLQLNAAINERTGHAA